MRGTVCSRANVFETMVRACQMKSILCLFGMLAVACASGFYDLPAYSDNGQTESLSRFHGNVTLVVNTAHL
jgi:hypothetical protein